MDNLIRFRVICSYRGERLRVVVQDGQLCLLNEEGRHVTRPDVASKAMIGRSVLASDTQDAKQGLWMTFESAVLVMAVASVKWKISTPFVEEVRVDG